VQQLDLRPLVAYQPNRRREHALDDRVEVHRLDLQVQLARVDFRQVEDVVDDGQQMLAAGQDLVHVLPVLRRQLHAVVHGGEVEHGLAEADDRVERRAQLVAHVRQELAAEILGLFFGPARDFERRVGLLQLFGEGGLAQEAFLERLAAVEQGEGGAALAAVAVERPFGDGVQLAAHLGGKSRRDGRQRHGEEGRGREDHSVAEQVREAEGRQENERQHHEQRAHRHQRPHHQNHQQVQVGRVAAPELAFDGRHQADGHDHAQRVGPHRQGELVPLQEPGREQAACGQDDARQQQLDGGQIAPALDHH